jgi:CRP/FNR family transcriptional regulator, cyclic AMP receptor protein
VPVRTSPILSCLNQRELKRLAKNVREQTFLAGTTVVIEGKMSGVGFHIITEGEALVTIRGEEVAQLDPGGHFGELGLIGHRERAATVTAVTPLTCQVLATWIWRISSCPIPGRVEAHSPRRRHAGRGAGETRLSRLGAA